MPSYCLNMGLQEENMLGHIARRMRIGDSHALAGDSFTFSQQKRSKAMAHPPQNTRSFNSPNRYCPYPFLDNG